MSTAAVNLPPEDLKPGQVIDARYRVEARLAHGGMATVYRAFDDRLDRPVALKVIDAKLARRPEYVARFIREAKSAAKLNHPNIVGVYDQSAIKAASGSDGGTLAYLAMEYVPGSTLRQVLGRKGRLTPRQALQVLDAMLAGLGAAHRAGIVHRDVKPENVLVNDAVLAQSHSYSAALKVTDFGLARSVTGESGPASSLPGGGLIGTASYLAPELVRFGTCDQRSDVYSAGIMLFELVTGRKPFTAGTPIQIAQQHVSSRVPAPSTLVPGLDPAVDALVLRATAREPQRRPDDANAMRSELRAAYAGLSDTALDFGAASVRGEATQPLGTVGAGATRVEMTGPAQSPTPTRVETAVTRLDQPVATRINPTANGAAGPPLPPIVPRRRPDDEPRFAAAGGQRRRSYRGLVVFLVIVLLAAAALLGAFFWGSSHYTSMPDLRGLPQSQAEQALTNDGLKYHVSSQSSSAVADGDVISTDPGSDQPISTGDTVTLTISTGTTQNTIPNVLGMSQSDASAKLQADGFQTSVSSNTQTSSTYASGTVASYAPEGTASQGSTVTLVLSAGPPQVTVPSVTGMNVGDATAKLQADGFHVVTHHVTMFFNTVVNQSPGGNGTTDAGGTVTLYY